jgi:hypothetical protein
LRKLRSTIASTLVAVALACAFALGVSPATKQAYAATPNVTVGAGQVVVIPFHVSGAISATVASIAKFNMPFACDLLGVQANAQALVGATNTVDVKVGGTTVLSAPMTIAAAGTVVEGTLVTTAIADEAVITIDINIVGTSLTHTTVLITCSRR